LDVEPTIRHPGGCAGFGPRRAASQPARLCCALQPHSAFARQDGRSKNIEQPSPGLRLEIYSPFWISLGHAALFLKIPFTGEHKMRFTFPLSLARVPAARRPRKTTERQMQRKKRIALVSSGVH